MPIEKECKICSKSFFVPPCRVKKSKYCSLDCLHKGNKKGNDRKCNNCNRIFYPRPNAVKKGYGKYCSP